MEPRDEIAVPAQDSSSSLQAQLNAAVASGSGAVHVPLGVYDLHTPINLPKGILLDGGGSTFVAHGQQWVFGTASRYTQIQNMRIEGTYQHGIWHAPVQDFRISDITLLGGTGNGIYLGQAQRGLVERCVIDRGLDAETHDPADPPNLNQFADGIKIEVTGGIDNVFRCNEIRNTTNGGIICNNTTRTVVEENLIDTVSDSGTITNRCYGIQFYYFPGAQGWTNTGNVARRNRIYRTDGTGIYVLASPETLVDDNHLADVCRTQVDDGSILVGGICISPEWDEINEVGDPQSTMVRRNSVLRCGKSGIVLFGDTMMVTGNDVDGADYGFNGRGLKYVTIAGNSFRRCTGDPVIYNWSWVPNVAVLMDNNAIQL